MNYAKALYMWLGFLAVAIAGALIQENLLMSMVGQSEARAVSTMLVSAVIFGLICAYVSRLDGATPGSLVRLGIFWTVLTILVDYFFRHFVLGVSWEFIGVGYNISQGRLWPLELLVILFGPLFAGKIRDYWRGRKSA
jgi:branched-subunit amino acid transport protein